MIVQELIEYFRSLANTHQDIQCFRTGENYELNESGLSYPLLFLNTDFNFQFESERTLLESEDLVIQTRISVLVLSQENYDERPSNEIKFVEQTKQNQDLNTTFTILNQIVCKVVQDLNDNFLNGWQLLANNGGTSLKRIINDDCDGWYIDLRIKCNNEVRCDFENYFGEDELTIGEDKNQFT